MTFQDALPSGQAGSPGANADRGAPTLWPEQRDCLDALVAAQAAGNNRLLVKMPTGTGKTVTFAALLQWPGFVAWMAQFPKNERRVLVIAHREELLDQAADKIRRTNPDLMVSIEQGDRHANTWSDVVIASIQTLSAMKFRRLHKLMSRHKFRLVIVDEAHHAAAASYRTALVHLGFLPPGDASESGEIEAVDYDDVAVMEQALLGWEQIAPKDRLLLGFTATPNRSDAIGLGCVFQTIAYSYELRKAIADAHLVPPVPWVVETKQSLDAVKITAGDFNQKQLAEAVNNQVRNELALAAWKEKADGLSTIAFTVDVAHAHSVAECFRAAGVPAEALSGETPKEDRRNMLRRYTEGTLEVIANCMVLTEGTDLPRTSCILHLKPTKSATLYEQMTGRGLRLYPGKTQCTVIDVVDIARRHSLMAAPVLYGLPPGCKTEGETLAEMAEALERLREKYPGFDLDAAFKNGLLTLDELNAKASTFDIWTVQSLGAFGIGRALSWIKVATDVFRLQYPWADGIETLSVQRDLLGKWDISLELRSNVTNARRQRTLAMEIDTADAAAGIAEAFVLQERRSVTRIMDKTASWRSKGPSPKQLALLKKMGVPIPKGPLTAGQASELLDQAFARRGGRR